MIIFLENALYTFLSNNYYSTAFLFIVLFLAILIASNCAAKKIHHVSHFFVQIYKIYLHIFLSVKASFDAFEVLR